MADIQIDTDDACSLISDGGALSRLSASFEERAVQVQLLSRIADAFNNQKIGVFEAGTGVGKSYAYLIPAALWALQNKQKVVISTGTINLQQQLCEKDLPAVEKILGKKINYILLKGRQNYVCRRRLEEAAATRELFGTETEEFDRLFEWAKTTESGSRTELPFFPGEGVWARVNSESDACMGARCPFFGMCFVMKIRKKAVSADVIVVNHHLLFADIESRLGGISFDDPAVLPPYRHVVFDEAHGIEAAATSFFSKSMTRFAVTKLVNQMYRRRKNAETGHLCTLAILSANEERAERAAEVTGRIKKTLERLEVAAKDVLGNSPSLRLCDETARNFGPFLVAAGEFSEALGEFYTMIHTVLEGVPEEDRDVPACWEAKIVLRRLVEVIQLLKDFCVWDEKRENVFWIQLRHLRADVSEDAEYVVLNETPLDISGLMNSGVYEEMRTVICTSATLKTGSDYNYWLRRNGGFFVERERLSCGDFPSPFPYQKNLLFAVPNDAPFSDSMEYQQYVELVLPKLIRAAEGRTLVLFTSYESLKSAYKTACAVLRDFPGRLLCQGGDDNARLLDAFRQETESVLFATDSFWQGVDVPGESLSQVVIVKLPFTVPNDPVFTARAEAVQRRGGNPFMELSVPEAVIKFRQGVGRLIRRSDDRGAVVVLDRRVYEKRYGSIFLASIPECRRVYAPFSELIKQINRFIFD